MTESVAMVMTKYTTPEGTTSIHLYTNSESIIYWCSLKNNHALKHV